MIQQNDRISIINNILYSRKSFIPSSLRLQSNKMNDPAQHSTVYDPDCDKTKFGLDDSTGMLLNY